GLNGAMHAAIETYDKAEPGSSVQVQAVRASVDAAVTRMQIMRAAGKVPRSLAGPSIAREMQVMFREFGAILERYEVPDDALRDLLELAETRMGQVNAIEGRELPSAA